MAANEARAQERPRDEAAGARREIHLFPAWPCEVALCTDSRSLRPRIATGHAHGSTLFEPIATGATRAVSR